MMNYPFDNLFGTTKTASLFSTDETIPVMVCETAEASGLRVSPFTPVYRVKLVQVAGLTITDRPVLRSPNDVASVLSQHLEGVDREHFVVIMVSTKNAVIGVTTVSVGDLNSALVHPREEFTRHHRQRGQRDSRPQSPVRRPIALTRGHCHYPAVARGG